jgi:hypothetical protein
VGHLSPLSRVKMLEAFCHFQFQRLRPSACSSSAMRASASWLGRSFSKRLLAFSRNCRFQRARISGLKRRSRAISAWLLAPLILSSTTRALNSALYVRLLTIVNSPFVHHNPTKTSVQTLVHFSRTLAQSFWHRFTPQPDMNLKPLSRKAPDSILLGW